MRPSTIDQVCWQNIQILSPVHQITYSVVSIYRYLSITSTNEANGWYGGTLLGDQDENSEIYRHYAQFCQVQILLSCWNDILIDCRN